MPVWTLLAVVSIESLLQLCQSSCSARQRQLQSDFGLEQNAAAAIASHACSAHPSTVPLQRKLNDADGAASVRYVTKSPVSPRVCSPIVVHQQLGGLSNRDASLLLCCTHTWDLHTLLHTL